MSADPRLPAPRGPLSDAVIEALRSGVTVLPPVEQADPNGVDPLGEDLQLALYCLYELHYRGFDGVPDEREWDPSVLTIRAAMEHAFLDRLRADVEPGDDVAAELDALLVEPVEPAGLAQYLRTTGEPWQVREYVTHRSLYHLKEADPQAWVIPRLSGAAKAGLVTVEHDEYGAGDARRMHSELFAAMMRALDLDPAYGAHLDAVPAETLAEVNLMSYCGLHRGMRGALVGQFAAVELTSSPGSDRLVRAFRRLGLPDAAIAFYAEHVEADAVHEQVVRRNVIAPMLASEPHLAVDVVFGIRAAEFLAGRFADRVLADWTRGASSLRG